MILSELSEKVARISDIYAAEHLRLSGRARGTPDPAALGDEAADVLGMLLIYCDRAGIDLEQAMQRKWLHWLEPKTGVQSA